MWRTQVLSQSWGSPSILPPLAVLHLQSFNWTIWERNFPFQSNLHPETLTPDSPAPCYIHSHPPQHVHCGSWPISSVCHSVTGKRGPQLSKTGQIGLQSLSSIKPSSRQMIRRPEHNPFFPTFLLPSLGL